MEAWYEGQVQQAVMTALQRNDKTGKSKIPRLKVRVWIDNIGHVARVKLSGSTNDTTLDQSIDSVLASVVMSDSPPKDMTMQPISMYINATRPN